MACEKLRGDHIDHHDIPVLFVIYICHSWEALGISHSLRGDITEKYPKHYGNIMGI